MRHRTRFALAALMVLCSASVGHTIPQLINYQGVLLDGSGNPITTSTSIVFAIWNDPTVGDSLWSETQSVTPDAAGSFNVPLGSVSPIPDSAFGGDAFLSLKVESDPEMTPRLPLVSVPNAYRPGTVDGASGGDITSKVSIGPGHKNTGDHAFIAGANNVARGDYSVVAGGGGATESDSNSAGGHWASVGGGLSNAASGQVSTVGGGAVNTASEIQSTVSGGFSNTASAANSTVGGGQGNTASGARSTVGGGFDNTASEFDATVGGGSFNRARGKFSVVAGGGGFGLADSNSAIGESSAISGGRRNIALGDYSVVSGGRQNSALGPYSMVPGGRENEAGARYTFAAGRRAKATLAGAFVWADSTDADYFSTARNQFRVRASGGTQIHTNSALTAGVTLAAGASAWAMVSDRDSKRNIRPVDGQDILAKLAQLPISRWSYKAQDPGIEHIGPMAQDFYRLFGLGDDDKTISTLDPDGIALAAIQELHKRTQRIDRLESELGELRSLVQELMAERR